MGGSAGSGGGSSVRGAERAGTFSTGAASGAAGAHLVARLNERICAMRGFSPVNVRMDPLTVEVKQQPFSPREAPRSDHALERRTELEADRIGRTTVTAHHLTVMARSIRCLLQMAKSQAVDISALIVLEHALTRECSQADAASAPEIPHQETPTAQGGAWGASVGVDRVNNCSSDRLDRLNHLNPPRPHGGLRISDVRGSAWGLGTASPPCCTPWARH